MADLIDMIFNNNTDGKLAKLISRRVEAETKLDSCLKKLNEYVESRAGSNLDLDIKYHQLKKTAETADGVWTKCYLDVLAYEPENIQEVGQKILVSLNSISEGLSDPRLHDSIEKCALKLLEVESTLLSGILDGGTIQDCSGDHRLFIIDDSEFDRTLIKQAFLSQNDNLDLIEMENGNAVIEAIKSKRPVATLLDLNMPFVSGLEILKMIRRDTELKDHPVWIISASSKEGDKTQSLSSGADGYYVKPDSLAAYNEMAANILECVAA